MTSVSEIKEKARNPRRWGWWYVTELRLREMKGYVSYVVTSSFGNPLIYLLALGIGLANLIPEGIEGVPFLVFVAPALLMSTILTIGAEEGMYPVLGGFKWQKIFYAIHATPITPGQIVGGFLVHLTIRFGFTAAVFYGFLVAFDAVPLASGWLMIPIAILGAFSILTPLGAYSAGIEDDRGQFALIQRLVVMPMFLFSGRSSRSPTFRTGSNGSDGFRRSGTRANSDVSQATECPNPFGSRSSTSRCCSGTPSSAGTSCAGPSRSG